MFEDPFSVSENGRADSSSIRQGLKKLEERDFANGTQDSSLYLDKIENNKYAGVGSGGVWCLEDDGTYWYKNEATIASVTYSKEFQVLKNRLRTLERNQYPARVHKESGEFKEWKRNQKLGPKARAILDASNFAGNFYVESTRADDAWVRQNFRVRMRSVGARVLLECLMRKDYKLALAYFAAIIRYPIPDVKLLQRIGVELLEKCRPADKIKFQEWCASAYTIFPLARLLLENGTVTALLGKAYDFTFDVVVTLWKDSGAKAAFDRLESVITSQPYATRPEYWALDVLLAIDLEIWPRAVKGIRETYKLGGTIPDDLIQRVAGHTKLKLPIERNDLPSFEPRKTAQYVSSNSHSDEDCEESSEEHAIEFLPVHQLGPSEEEVAVLQAARRRLEIADAAHELAAKIFSQDTENTQGSGATPQRKRARQPTADESSESSEGEHIAKTPPRPKRRRAY